MSTDSVASSWTEEQLDKRRECVAVVYSRTVNTPRNAVEKRRFRRGLRISDNEGLEKELLKFTCWVSCSVYCCCFRYCQYRYQYLQSPGNGRRQQQKQLGSETIKKLRPNQLNLLNYFPSVRPMLSNLSKPLGKMSLCKRNEKLCWHISTISIG